LSKKVKSNVAPALCKDVSDLKPGQNNCEEWHGGLDGVSVGDRHLPDADVSQHGGGKLAESQRNDELEKVLPRKIIPRHSDSQKRQHRARVDCHRQQLNHREGHWIRKIVLARKIFVLRLV